MADMNFKVNLLPNSDLGNSLGSSQKRWNIYGYSSNTISWDSTNKKLQQTVSSSGAADVLSFAAGDGINLTAAASSLTIAAKTSLVTPNAGATSSFYALLSNSTDNSGILQKNANFVFDVREKPSSWSSGIVAEHALAKITLGSDEGVANGGHLGSIILKGGYAANSILAKLGPDFDGYDLQGALELGNTQSKGVLKLYAGGTAQTIKTVGGNNTYLLSYDPSYGNTANYYIGFTKGGGLVGNSGLPVYISGGGEIEACTKSDIQANIFVISDTAPADTSVIWLKPVSSTS